ncbi:hypothetical protein [Nocardia sp. NPDC057030]|uniref:nSTAND1 domain-containing NTPase n=1 Tax=unclassified Nocardia TaxID=2637762 RepID=UPI00363748A7
MQQFAALFAAAGNPSLRRVAAAAEARMRGARPAGQKGAASVQRISDWKSGRNVPARFESLLPVLLTLIDEVRKSSAPAPAAWLDVQEWQRLWSESNAWNPESEFSECPYLGLTSYRREDSELFFGRARPTAELAELVRDTVGPAGHGGIIVLVGASGAGKSSLLHAGLIPALADPADQWATVTITPGTNPALALLAAIDIDGSRSLDGADFLGAVLGSWAPDRRRLLIVDQFEELFTLCRDDKQRTDFLAALEHIAIRGERAPAAVVISVRADFYARCLDIPLLEDALKHRSYLLGPMRLDELAEAITRPAELAGYKLESGLEELIISELCGLGGGGVHRGYDPGALPLVSHVMEAVWQRREGARFTIDGYRAADGVLGSVAATAERAWNELSEFQQAVGKHVLLGLVTVGDDSRDTRRKVARAELVGQTVEAAETALEVLARTRLITLDAESAYLTHEIVLNAWPRLRIWIDEDRVGYLERQRLHVDATDWVAHERDSSLLYRGARLVTMQEHAAGGAIGPAAQEFLAAGQAARRRAQRRTSAIRAALVILTVAALALAGVAFVQNDRAKQQRDRAILSSVLAEADRVRDSDPSLSAQLTLVANRLRPGDAGVRARLFDSQSLALATPLTDNAGTGPAVALRPDGGVLAVSGTDNGIRLLDIADGASPKQLAQIATNLPVGEYSSQYLGFNPDGTMLACMCNRTLRLWDMRDPANPAPISVTGLAGDYGLPKFSPDGRVLTASNGDERAFWDIRSPVEPKKIDVRLPIGRVSEEYVPGPVSPNWRLMSSTKNNEGIQLFDTSDLHNIRALGRLPGRANDSWFSPDGRTLVVAFPDKEIKDKAKLELWDIADPNTPRRIGIPITVEASPGVVFSPDGKRMVVGLAQGQAQVWALDEREHPLLFTTLTAGDKDVTWAMAFGPDGRLVTSGMNGAIRMWSLPERDSSRLGYTGMPTQLGLDAGGRVAIFALHPEFIETFRIDDPLSTRQAGRLRASTGNAAVSPDGRTLLASAPTEGKETFTEALFDVSDPAAIHRLADFPGQEYFGRGVFSPDSRFLVTILEESPTMIRIWDLADRNKPVLVGPPISAPNVSAGAFSPDGRLLATWGRKAPVTLWDMTVPPAPRALSSIPAGRDGAREPVAFAPDSRTLIAGTGDDRSIGVWDITDPRHPAAIGNPLTGHTGTVQSLAFSPDGRTLASSSPGSEVLLWDFSDRLHPTPVKYPLLTAAPVDGWELTFHPSGKYLMTGSALGALRWWDLDPQHAVDRICAATSSVLTEQVWAAHLPDLPFRPPCAQH